MQGVYQVFVFLLVVDNYEGIRVRRYTAVCSVLSICMHTPCNFAYIMGPIIYCTFKSMFHTARAINYTVGKSHGAMFWCVLVQCEYNLIYTGSSNSAHNHLKISQHSSWQIARKIHMLKFYI
jgi:hypothetical protein